MNNAEEIARAIAYNEEAVTIISNHGRGAYYPVSVSSGGGRPDMVWVRDGAETKVKRKHVNAMLVAGIPCEIVAS